MFERPGERDRCARTGGAEARKGGAEAREIDVLIPGVVGVEPRPAQPAGSKYFCFHVPRAQVNAMT